MLVAAHEIDVDNGSEQVYNAMDCCLTHEIFGTLKQQIPLAVPSYGFELALQAPVLEMMLRGFRCDPAARELGIQTCQRDLARLDHVLVTLTEAVLNQPVTKRNPKGKLILPGSAIQLKEVFYDYLGITPIKTWSKGEVKLPMDREVIEQIEDYFQARPIAAAVLAHRDKTKELSVLETEVDDDWRMRTSYNIGGTKSARFSSSKSPDGTGTNLQNITEDLRHILIADPGFILCGIDAEQSDSRMVGFMCGLLFDDWTYLDACESGDLHTYVARMTWPNDLPWTGDLKKDRVIAERPYYRHFSYRDSTKKLGHGTNFLGKAPTLSKLIHIPRHLIIPFQEKYFTGFPAIQQWQVWTASELQSKQQLTSIHGRKRDFFDRTNADETVRKGLAFLAAAPTADNLNLGMWRVWRHMPEVQLLAQVHDAIYFQFPEGMDKAKVVGKAQELMAVPLSAPNGRQFIVPTEAKLGYNWGNASDKNPKGLRKFTI